jgi:hypothetical protein
VIARYRGTDPSWPAAAETGSVTLEHVLPTVRKRLRDDEILREAGETELLTVSLGEHPRLRGAAALIGTPAFAATDVS